jgi:hypothetical protein
MQQLFYKGGDPDEVLFFFTNCQRSLFSFGVPFSLINLFFTIS